MVRVDPLEHQVAVKLLASRVIDLSDYFTALFNCLACGIPRDLLRVARAAILFAPVWRDRLDHIAARLVERELERITGSVDALPPELSHDLNPVHGTLCEIAERVTDATLANRLYFLDTILGVFALEKIQAHGRNALDAPSGDPISFSTLAATGSRLGVADRQCRDTLQNIRKAWGLQDIPHSLPSL